MLFFNQTVHIPGSVTLPLSYKHNSLHMGLFPWQYPDMDDLANTCSDFVNALKMLICSEKHPVSRANYGYTKKVVIERWATI